MAEQELMMQMETTIRLLYQNKESEALQAVKELLPVLQKELQYFLEVGENERCMQCVTLLKDLLENFQSQDMLGMADCLQGWKQVLA